jgi:hypothetical protein
MNCTMYESDQPVLSVRWVAEPRIANPPLSLLIKYTRKEKNFFYGYASFVVRIIQDPMISDRILRTMSIENVSIRRPIDVRVMVFPALSFRGHTNRMLHGSYNSTASQISVYPLRIPKEWIRNAGFDLFEQAYLNLSGKRKKLLHEISMNAIGTLLHEVFHAKLANRGMSRFAEESVVRKMEKQYMIGWEETVSAAAQSALSRSP